MTTDSLTARALELIQADPDLDIYHAIEIAREETELERDAARLAQGAAIIVPIILLVIVWSAL